MQYNPTNILINDTICALATSAGTAAIAVIRLSGPKAFEITEQIFVPVKKGLKMEEVKSHSIHFGTLHDGDKLLDEVLISFFRNPKSFTGEDAVEISCHGSIYIQQKIMELLISRGARLAEPGEYTMRGFMNGKFDLSQAEAVADLISANSKAAHDLALNQMRGGYSLKIKDLRTELINFASLIELELDFGEEDVEFANREQLNTLLIKLKSELSSLVSSFKVGNVIKKGIPVAIVGEPNVGKSTLLNAILNEEKAIVSDIPGTTRDLVEDTITIEGVSFRFIDTAGIRQSEDEIEKIGIERTYDVINKARIVLFVFDITTTTCHEVNEILADFRHHIDNPHKHFVVIANKIDELIEAPKEFGDLVQLESIFVSAKRKENIHLIVESLVGSLDTNGLSDQTIVSNVRHLNSLQKALDAINTVEDGFENEVPSDLIAIDIRTALHHLGEITGEITTDDILGNIFGKFCIGK
ncbi:MAG: tRNA uridine-5-carboxymethylaminomethyl(34) synthesis GTPase MnmE [Bacteroidales bacterium]|nr:tRNA uridine-5-carboxymethylaminomethyl(34) synthesis GTPase MnmE [Bacteroidales bacterium]